MRPARIDAGRAIREVADIDEYIGQRRCAIIVKCRAEISRAAADGAGVAVGAGAGAVIGAIMGGKSGAAKGAVLGGAAGTGAVMATRGEEVRLEAGTEVPARLAAPLAIQIRLH